MAKSQKTGRIRILFTNANGLSPRHNNLETEYYIQNCAANQADIIGTVEVNRPLTTPIVQNNWKDCDILTDTQKFSLETDTK